MNAFAQDPGALLQEVRRNLSTLDRYTVEFRVIEGAEPVLIGVMAVDNPDHLRFELKDTASGPGGTLASDGVVTVFRSPDLVTRENSITKRSISGFYPAYRRPGR